LVPDFVMAIRAADDRWAVENSARILEVYSVGPQVNFACFDRISTGCIYNSISTMSRDSRL
jgi:hypothetical protein